MVWNVLRGASRQLRRSPTAMFILAWSPFATIDNKRSFLKAEQNDLADWYELGFRHLKKLMDNDADVSKSTGPWSLTYKNVAVFALKGRRPSMEDRFNVISYDSHVSSSENFRLFGVYDGHGGSAVAEKVEEQLLQNLATRILNAKHFDVVEQEMIQASLHLDDQLKRVNNDNGFTGSTAIFGFIHRNDLVLANIGDCRAIGIDSNSRKTVQLSKDHKPNFPSESQRIRSADGNVLWNGVWRLNGILAVSRAFGDFSLKTTPNLLIAEPEVFRFDLTKEGFDFILLASDGLWDVFSSEEAGKFISNYLKQLAREIDENPQEKMIKLLTALEKLAIDAIQRGSMDNITIMLVDCKNL